MDAFDANVLIYAAAPGHVLGRRIAALFPSADEPGGIGDPVGVGSLVLLPEVLAKPRRAGFAEEVAALNWLLGQLDLRAVDREVADLATVLGATYRLRAADAIHLATAVQVGADRFITGNTRDFGRDIAEVTITYPDDLPDPGPPAPTTAEERP
jgi:predicted nucleic acid-binding protein